MSSSPDPYLEDGRRRRSTARRTRSVIVGRRRNQHPFVPSPGHPSLCAHCNAGPDDESKGTFIHSPIRPAL